MAVYSFEPGTGNNLSGVYDLHHTGWQLTVMEIVERLNRDAATAHAPKCDRCGFAINHLGGWIDGKAACNKCIVCLEDEYIRRRRDV